jgi:hypothetical protein
MPLEGVMDCPKCGKWANCKDDQVNSLQIYLCKNCNHRHTVAQRSTTGDAAMNHQAIELCGRAWLEVYWAHTRVQRCNDLELDQGVRRAVGGYQER